MDKASRTVNPLHFEDLEPHRFEDLVRQLAYSYRVWRYLDATGRLGRDGGLDIRGIEIVVAASPSSDSGNTADDPDAEETEADGAGGQTTEERSWSIQCKRYKVIGPTLMREIVAETVPDPSNAPYGLIIAAACDVSAETLAAFREEALARGVQEAHPWTKAHLEDKLFLPGNDHLLFAYFGLSLGIRQQSQLAKLRGAIAIKKKLQRAFSLDSARDVFLKEALIRDVSDTHYPVEKHVPDFSKMRAAPWHFVRVAWFHPDGIMVCRFGYDGWVKQDRTWDIYEDSRIMQSAQGMRYRHEENLHIKTAPHGTPTQIISQIPEVERKHIRELWLLPYANILEVDSVGEALIEGPHIYCRFDSDEGPYKGPARFLTNGAFHGDQIRLLPDKRGPLYEALSKTNEGEP